MTHEQLVICVDIVVI